MIIDEKDIITCESYKGLCDYVYQDGMEPAEGLVHVNMEEIPSFFLAISKFPERKYVVVSSCSDFGLCYQERSPVWVDMPKWARMMASPDLEYKRAVLEPRCDLNKCNMSHKYSSKCYSYTAFTFPEIPSNIKHWFMTNSRIGETEERITIIPFGIAANGKNDLLEVARESHQKEPKLYVNWVNYTVDRLDIKEYYRMIKTPDITIVDEAKPYKEYLRDLARHLFIVSPEGNGVDCYRTLESIYLDSIPITQLSAVTIALGELPMAVVFSMFGLQPRTLLPFYDMIRAQNRPLNKVKLSYWKNKFEEEKGKL